MNNIKLVRYLRLAGLLLVSALLGGCPCPDCDVLVCGEGTLETMIGLDRTCVITPVSCGTGAHEQATGGQRECVPNNPGDVLECGTSTHEQATGGQRECVPGGTSCAAGEIEVLNPDNSLSCESVHLDCADGTHEQTTGGQRECVLNDVNLACGNGTKEQTTGGQRECVPDP